MTKETLMQLADDYAEQVQSWGSSHSRAKVERKALSNAIGAALKQARVDALEDAADRAYHSLLYHSDLGGVVAAEIRSLKEQT